MSMQNQQQPQALAEWLATQWNDLMAFCDGETDVHQIATWFLEADDLAKLWAAFGAEAEKAMVDRDGTLGQMLRFYGFDPYDIEDAKTCVLAAHAESLLGSGAVRAAIERQVIGADGPTPPRAQAARL